MSLKRTGRCDGRYNIPNSFLMTLRIFLWSNFLGMPWTVVKVLRPLRSITKALVHSSSQRVMRDRTRVNLDRKTYAECEYGCKIPALEWSCLCPRRLRRRGLNIKQISDLFRMILSSEAPRLGHTAQATVASRAGPEERTVGLEVFDGHKPGFSGVTGKEVVVKGF